ncbi:MAG: ABC transporter permease [Candidatus Cloacimonetes bacterium]|nr:ABC transporter permease [Candidatus Cloacimonadota bacterium]
MKFILKKTLQEIKYFWRFSSLFMFILSLGITSLLVFDSIHESFLKHFENNSKNILRADIKVSSFEPISSKVKDMVFSRLKVDYESSYTSSFLSNLVLKKENKLSQINAIDSLFPLYGDIKLSTKLGVKYLKEDKFRLNENEIILDDSLAKYLNIKLGDQVKLGKISLAVTAIILEDSGRAFEFSSFLPKAFITHKSASNTGLLQFGARIQYNLMLKSQQQLNVIKLSQSIQQQFDQKLKEDHSYTIKNFNEASGRINRNLSFFKSYLSFVSIIALILCLSGITYLYRSYLYEKVIQIAVMMSLGSTQNKILAFGTSHIFVLSTLSMLIATFFSTSILKALPYLIPNLVPKNLNIIISTQLILFTFATIFILCLASCYPLLKRLSQLEPALLFQNRDFQFYSPTESRLKKYLDYLPLAFSLCFLCFYRSHDPSIAFGFLFGLITIFFIIYFSALLFLKGIAKLKFSNVYTRLSILNLTRNKQAFLLSSVSFGIGCLLIGVLPQLQVNIEKEMLSSQNFIIPEYFLFDVQDDQVDELSNYITINNARISHLTPMIRGRVKSVNNTPFKDWVLSNQDLSKNRRYGSLLLRRGVNISYREALANSEQILQGNPLPNTYNESQAALVSLEQGFAENLNLTIGDQLLFNIQGMEFEAKVHNIRKVQWNSFQPNFFVLFQNGVLNDAPKTWLANLHLKTSDHETFQKNFYKSFQNISMVNLKEVIIKLMDMVQQITLCVQFLAWLCILVGFSVLYSIIRFDLEKQKKEVDLFSILGANINKIRRIYLVQQIVISTFSIVGAILSSYMISYAIWNIWFSSDFVINWQPLVLAPILFCLTLVINQFALKKVLNNSFELFQE